MSAVVQSRMPEPVKRRGGASGTHVEPRRLCSGSPAQLAQWSAKAKAAGLSWADWSRMIQDAACKRAPALAAAQEGPFPSRRVLSATAEQWLAWDARAHAIGVSWADWYRRLADAA